MENIAIEGVQDILTIFEDRLVIEPKGFLGFLNKGIKGKKEIPFSSITAIQFKEAGKFLNGYLQFSLPGGNESKKGIFSAVSDENTFMFPFKVNDEVKRAKDFINERIGNKAFRSQNGQHSIADELAKLKKLQDDGVISQQEFEGLKSQLIKKSA